tara:strand:+ start:679 stop:1932 length:1254 start_codon:yes stop_codon:yes gene_type:complete
MAATFKTFLNNDVTTTKTLLHEAIPITGAIVSGTYDQGKKNAPSVQSEFNIKDYSHGMFQSVYDYPFLSSSANHIFDISVGYSPQSALSGNVTSGRPKTQQSKKIAMYNQMAQVLMGHDKNGNIQRFDADGNLGDAADDKMDEVIFINFSRLLVKDEIKKGSFQLKLGTQPRMWHTVTGQGGDGLRDYVSQILTIRDTNAQNDFRINSPAGEYGILSASHTAKVGAGVDQQEMVEGRGPSSSPRSDNSNVLTDTSKVGLIFYQAGVIVLTSSVFHAAASGGILQRECEFSRDGAHGRSGAHNNINIDHAFTGSTIKNIANNIRRRVHDISFNNTTELNSTVYFCRANHNEFNYSANPTYLSNSKIVVKEVPSDMPISYVTSVGLYSPDNELMAVAKLSEPLRKDPTNELTLRVRLDY